MWIWLEPKFSQVLGSDRGPFFPSSKSHVKSWSQIWVYLILHPVLNKNCATNHISNIFISSNLCVLFFPEEHILL